MTMIDYQPQLETLIKSAGFAFSDMLPSEWAERNRYFTSAVSPFPGKMDWNRTPYLREILDLLSPYSPIKEIGIMKGAQIGFTTTVIESGIGYTISENPGNILLLVGHDDLSDESMNRIDTMIDTSGLRHLIRANTMRVRNQRTGDTNKSKEFPGGSLVSGSGGNHKLLMQRSVKIGFIDDYDAVKGTSKEDGSTRSLIRQRFAAYYDRGMKIFYISTPRLKKNSNIEDIYLKGDQRKWNVPCPCCGALIVLEWTVPIEGSNEKAGIFYKLDDAGQLIPGTVGYVCQECGGFFDDSKKYEMNLNGVWIPSAVPEEPNTASFHISSLNAPPGMFDWEHYVRQYIDAVPFNGEPNEAKEKTFYNVVLGLPYEERGETIKANELQQNVRPYEIGTVPEKLSIADGNGQIVLLTCACDLNGVLDDARLDWEVVAWSESGASYSVQHGSIGTFVPREGSKKFKEDRAHYTYEHHRPNSVWPEFEKILKQKWQVDTGRKMLLLCTTVDCGYHSIQAYSFIDNTNSIVYGVKGKDLNKAMRINANLPKFHPSREKPGKLYMLEVNAIKDELASMIRLKWDSGNDDRQPDNFMNYPTPSGGFYLFKNFFSHYEAEHRIVESKDGQPVQTRWVKKSVTVQNHFWDVRIYNIAAKEIFVHLFCKEYKIKNPSWQDYVNIIKSQLRL